MTCDYCKKRIEEVIIASGRGESIEVNLAVKTVELDSDLNEKEIIALIDEAGYDAVRI